MLSVSLIALGVIPLPRCVVPALRVLNPVMSFGKCLLKFPREKQLTLVNDSDFPGCYHLLSQVWPCLQLLPSNVTGGRYYGNKKVWIRPCWFLFKPKGFQRTGT